MDHAPNTDAQEAALRIGPRQTWAIHASAVLRPAIEIPATLILLAEIVVLLAGITARYIFQAPLVWTDELAGILFLWLAMLGSVLAFQKGEHMRMTAIAARMPPGPKAFLDAVAVVAPLAFLVLCLPPAWAFATDESFVVTPVLEISNAWRAAAIPVGLALMALVAVLRLVTEGRPRDVFAAAATVFATIGLLVLAAPALAPLGNLNLLVFFVGLVGLMVLGAVPIAFAFGLATLGYITLTTSIPDEVVIGRLDEGMSHFILLAIPLFVFLGLLIEMTGMARAMVDFLASLLGHVRGGLHYVLVGAMYLVSGISGSKAADMAAIAPVLFPEMKARGADEGDLVALLAATGAQTETIPPSIVLITIGSVTGVSITALFTGGLLPGVVLGVTLCALVWWRFRNEDMGGATRPPARIIVRAFVVAIPALALPFVIRAAVIEGVATATEVSTIGIAYSVATGLLVYRRFDWRRLFPMLVTTVTLSGAILLIIGTATGMAWALTQSGFSSALAAFMTGLPGGVPTFLAVNIAAFIVLGSVLEGIPAIVLFGPLLFPIARQEGVNEVHYAMVVILSMGIGLFAPPFGVGYYAACAVSRVSPDRGMRPIVGYMIALLIGTIIIAAVPWISTVFL
ncbi:MAG: TRAP transporter large permease subunit [Janthinobacterium lividum]